MASTALSQLDGILDGTTKLAYGGGDGHAKTELGKDGNRTVYLNNYKEGMTDEEQFKMGIELGHEAHRDGLTGTEQEQQIETINAVQGHTVMAMRMQNDPKYKEMMNNLIVNDGNLVDDMLALQNGDMVNHVLGNYDTSADYWKVLPDGTLVNDGDGWLKDASGNRIKNAAGEDIGAQGIETGLLNILNGGTSGVANGLFSDNQVVQAQLLMEMSGMTATNSDGARKNWGWDHNDKGIRLNMDLALGFAGDTVANPVFERYYNHTMDTQIAGIVGANLGFEKNKWVSPIAQGRYATLLNERMTGYGGVDHIVKDALYERYFDTVGGEQVYRMDENNPIVSDLMSQHDPAFKNKESSTYLSGMPEGCNVMAIIGYSQMLAGKAFDALDIATIWNEGLKEGNDWLETDGYVNSRSALANAALKTLGLGNLGIDVGERPENKTTVQIGNRLNIPKKHFLAGDLWGNVIYNSGNSTDSSYKWMPVWAYQKEAE